jgi:hypothetical protein
MSHISNQPAQTQSLCREPNISKHYKECVETLMSTKRVKRTPMSIKLDIPIIQAENTNWAEGSVDFLIKLACLVH